MFFFTRINRRCLSNDSTGIEIFLRGINKNTSLEEIHRYVNYTVDYDAIQVVNVLRGRRQLYAMIHSPRDVLCKSLFCRDCNFGGNFNARPDLISKSVRNYFFRTHHLKIYNKDKASAILNQINYHFPTWEINMLHFPYNTGPYKEKLFYCHENIFENYTFGKHIRTNPVPKKKFLRGQEYIIYLKNCDDFNEIIQFSEMNQTKDFEIIEHPFLHDLASTSSVYETALLLQNVTATEISGKIESLLSDLQCRSLRIDENDQYVIYPKSFPAYEILLNTFKKVKVGDTIRHTFFSPIIESDFLCPNGTIIGSKHLVNHLNDYKDYPTTVLVRNIPKDTRLEVLWDIFNELEKKPRKIELLFNKESKSAFVHFAYFRDALYSLTVSGTFIDRNMLIVSRFRAYGKTTSDFEGKVCAYVLQDEAEFDSLVEALDIVNVRMIRPLGSTNPFIYRITLDSYVDFKVLVESDILTRNGYYLYIFNMQHNNLDFHSAKLFFDNYSQRSLQISGLPCRISKESLSRALPKDYDFTLEIIQYDDAARINLFAKKIFLEEQVPKHLKGFLDPLHDIIAENGTRMVSKENGDCVLLCDNTKKGKIEPTYCAKLYFKDFSQMMSAIRHGSVNIGDTNYLLEYDYGYFTRRGLFAINNVLFVTGFDGENPFDDIMKFFLTPDLNTIEKVHGGFHIYLCCVMELFAFLLKDGKKYDGKTITVSRVWIASTKVRRSVVVHNLPLTNLNSHVQYIFGMLKIISYETIKPKYPNSNSITMNFDIFNALPVAFENNGRYYDSRKIEMQLLQEK